MSSPQISPMTAEDIERRQAQDALASEPETQAELDAAKAADIEEAKLHESVRNMRKHLKMQSKNQLVLLAMQLMVALQESNARVKFLNESLKNNLKAETETPNA
jgi:hypothetical protein